MSTVKSIEKQIDPCLVACLLPVKCLGFYMVQGSAYGMVLPTVEGIFNNQVNTPHIHPQANLIQSLEALVSVVPLCANPAVKANYHSVIENVDPILPPRML